jgi:hypothetical protein
MHPIERLRFIARAEDEPAASLATEAAYTLADLSHYEPNAVLTACRRLLDKHPECGPLWWVGSQLVGAADPFEVARRAAGDLCSDPTPDRLAEMLRASFTGGEAFVVGRPADLSVQALRRGRQCRLRLVGSSWALRRAVRGAAFEGVDDVTGYTPGDEDEALAGAAVVLIEPLGVGTSNCLLTPESAGLVATAREVGAPLWLVCGVGRALPESLFEALANRTGTDRGELVPIETFNLGVGPEGSCRPENLVAGVAQGQGLELLRRPV